MEPNSWKKFYKQKGQELMREWVALAGQHAHNPQYLN